MKDFYYILGTSRDATDIEIEAAYCKLARKLSQNSGEQDEFIDAHFHEIAEAYDTLRDASRRKKYDLAIKRNQARQLAVFGLKYLNIAVTITFLVVTALFTLYVIRVLRGHEAKTVVQKQTVQPPVTAIHPKKHHKHSLSATKKASPPPDTARLHPVPVVPAPAIKSQSDPDSTYTATLHANVTGIIYLHQLPDYNSAVLAKIPDASEVRVLEKGNTYYKVNYNGQTGYVIKGVVEGR